MAGNTEKKKWLSLLNTNTMAEDLKVGDEVVLKTNPKEHFVIQQIDIDGIKAKCIDSQGKERFIALIALQRPGFSGIVTGLYDEP